MISIIWKHLLWTRPLYTLATFLCGVMVYSLVEYGGYTLMTLLCYMALLQCLTAVIYVNSRRFSENLPRESEQRVFVTDATLVQWAHNIHAPLNEFLGFCVDVFSVSNSVLIGKLVAVLVVLSLLGRVVDGVSLLFSLHCAAHSLPLLYSMNETWVKAKLAPYQSMIAPSSSSSAAPTAQPPHNDNKNNKTE